MLDPDKMKAKATIAWESKCGRRPERRVANTTRALPPWMKVLGFCEDSPKVQRTQNRFTPLDLQDKHYCLRYRHALSSVLHIDKLSRGLRLLKHAGDISGPEAEALTTRFTAMLQTLNNDCERARNMGLDEDARMPQGTHSESRDPGYVNEVVAFVRECRANLTSTDTVREGQCEDAYESRLEFWEKMKGSSTRSCSLGGRRAKPSSACTYPLFPCV